MLQRLVIATRRSALALTQTRWIANRLERLYPDLKVELLELTTSGDRSVQTAAFGGKGLFIKELEEALARGDADIAVHSMKDVPMQLPPGFVIAAAPEREDARDAFVSNLCVSLEAAPAGAKIGTSSLRRMSAIRARYPHLDVSPLRGNVDTRLKKLDAKGYDGIVLAAAGLKRLGVENRITHLIASDEIIPAPGQGALAIEVLESHRVAHECVMPLDHAATRLCVEVERAVSSALAGDCNLPLGAYAEIHGDTLFVRAFVAKPDGSRMIADNLQGKAGDAAALGAELAKRLRALGADQILAEIKSAG